MSVRIAGLALGQVALAMALLVLTHQSGELGGVRPVVLLAGPAFGLVGSLTVHVELRRHACAVTMVEAVLVAALFQLRPVEVVVAVVAGELLACLLRRQPPLQLAFNVAAATFTSTVAAAAFSVLPAGGAHDPAAWGSALAAAGCYGLASHASTSSALALVEGRRFGQVFTVSLAPSAVATAVSATVGLLGVVLAAVNVAALLLVAPLVVLMVVETRRLAAHRADHLRFRRLYAASARTGRLSTRADAMTMLAAEARALVTGATAVCCTIDRAGRWHGAVVGDHGSRAASDAEVEALVSLRDRAAAVELTSGDVPPALKKLATPLESLVFSTSDVEAAVPVVVAVARQLPGDESAQARADVLAAFNGHAALAIANARLYEEVEEALAHQVDLNRQKDDFVAAVSHELRTPLTSMIGSMASIRRTDARLTQESRAVFLDIALRQGDRLKRLIEDLLMLSRMEASPEPLRPPTEVDVRSLVDDIAADLAGPRNGAPAVDIAFQAAASLTLRCDEDRLRQILTNLVDNARKYAPDSPVQVVAEVRADHVALHVIDHGPGVSPEDRERVFERFVQVDQSSTRAHGGTGLGLYLCRLLATALGGTLTLSEADGGGCQFTLSLPATIANVAGHDSLRPQAGTLVDA